VEQENWIYTNTSIWINAMLKVTSSLHVEFILILYKNIYFILKNLHKNFHHNNKDEDKHIWNPKWGQNPYPTP
jgi:hypothetical protein